MVGGDGDAHAATSMRSATAEKVVIMTRNPLYVTPRHSEFIRSLNAVEAEVPAGKMVRVNVRNAPTTNIRSRPTV
jgi:hypothetical protein